MAEVKSKHTITHSPASEWQSSLVFLNRVHHSQLHSQLSVWVRDDWVGKVPFKSAIGL